MTENNFEFNPTQVTSLWATLSKARLDRFKGLADSDDKKALELYCWNGALGNALYWPLHTFEISLRNALSDRIRAKYGDKWFDQIASYSSLGASRNNTEVEHIIKAKRKLNEDSYAHTHDNIVAATTLGFWNNLYKSEYEKSLYTPLFADLLDLNDREEAYKKVLQIKRLRNNVAHYEPIVVWPGGSQKRELYKDYKLILKLIRWLNTDAALFVESKSADIFLETWNECPNFFKVLPLKYRENGKEGSSDSWQWYTSKGPVKR